MAEVDGTVIDGQPDKTGGEWRAQLPSDLKENEAFTSYKTVGDFAKAHLETTGKVKEYEGKVKDLEGRTANLIPKITDKSTPEEISAYRTAMGVPEKPEGYEFPKIGDTENSPEMVAWAQKTFHVVGLTKEQGSHIQKEWTSFVSGMVEAENKMAEEEKVANEKKFRESFKSEEEYRAGYELAKRHWNKLTGTNFDEAYKEVEAWQKPLFMTYIFNAAKSTGEDFSPQGGQTTGGTIIPGMQYKDMDKFKGG